MASTVSRNGVRDEDSLRFFHVLASRDPNARKHGFDMIKLTLDAWVNGYGSPKDIIIADNGNPLPINPLVEEHLPDILRLSTNCPFEDVREWCANLLADIKENCSSIKIPRRIYGKGPSNFIPESEIVPVSTSEDQTQMLFVDAFLQNNRLDHVTQLMGYHPNYLEMFLRTQQYLLRGDGPLPFHYRHYIAIMAASRHQCAYLIHLHEQEFILQGGDPDWLKGPAHIPAKLQKLHQVNKILAHRPWLFNKSHIESLRKEAWSIAELVQAVVIMAHFHALSSFVFGCGIKNEPDHHGGFSYRPHSPTENANDSDYTSDSSSDCSSEPEVCIEILMERMKKLKESNEEEPTEEERLKRFEKVETQSAELAKPGKKPSPKAEVMKYVQDEEFCYVDFTKRACTEEAPTFRANEYSWDDHGFSIANRLYSEIGNLLDEKFSMAYNLTYYTMGEVIDVDTSAFRRAIWYYIHCLYGIMHDDYDYGQVNQLLERNLKAYIKTVTCYPERLAKKDYDNVMKEFKHSEKVHVNLMLLEARLQGELLYALRAVMQYMT